ncbi:SGNH/GDSL hydrolase family protein [Planococcus sp. S3-L1]|uniref:SGNH/GDSL hydrolase family protein n=1 Tax=Planococcus sp. S3-L1 TaxID=3046200 RepID=UPI0024B925F6|nr:SGNH/GDSL hydrolase family protein [Planococcus sp. S3-L1]MDJ0332971.1 SGNH/GDSL hydrolase family protein [Planococcus sp. S3-L1]
MNLYKIGAVLAVIICVIALVFSYFTWQDKLDNVLATPEVEETAAVDKKKDNKVEEENVDSVNVDGLTANMDEQLQEIFADRNDQGDGLKFLIAGSAALESGEPGYAERLTVSLEDAYGEFIDVAVTSMEGTSESLAAVDLSAGYDVVLLEPMTLMNNDRIAIEQEREHIRAFDARLTNEVADAAIVLHPAQPIFGAGYYLAQITALSEFAGTNGYTYIDHWSAWPDTDDIGLKDYLTQDGLPNDKGAALWAQELEAYFIAN